MVDQSLADSLWLLPTLIQKSSAQNRREETRLCGHSDIPGDIFDSETTESNVSDDVQYDYVTTCVHCAMSLGCKFVLVSLYCSIAIDCIYIIRKCKFAQMACHVILSYYLDIVSFYFMHNCMIHSFSLIGVQWPVSATQSSCSCCSRDRTAQDRASDGSPHGG